MSSSSTLSFIVLGISIIYAFIYPAFGDVSLLLGEKGKYDESLATVANIESKKGELLERFNKIPDLDKKNMETILPNSFDFVKLISQIDAVASRHGISADKITSKEIDSSIGDTIETSGPTRAYQSGIVGFSFESSYEQFQSFVDDLEKSLRILDIRTLKIIPQEKGIYSYSIEFETYWLQSQ